MNHRVKSRRQFTALFSSRNVGNGSKNKTLTSNSLVEQTIGTIGISFGLMPQVDDLPIAPSMKYLILLLLCSLVCDVSAQENKRPNIVLIVADDLGWGDLSCYGSKTIKTPNLDQLAATGVRCTDFHSNGAVCSPTRAALMTGRYQQRCGVNGVITAARHRHEGMALQEWTLGEALKDLGYETAMFGKWHLGYAPEFNPVHQGFDHYHGFVSGNIDYQRHIDQEGHFDWWVQDELQDEPGYLTDLLTDQSIEFIERQRGKPFLLVINHGAPHYPLQGRESKGFRVVGKKNKDQPRPQIKDPKATYREMIEVMDEGVGKIVTSLQEQNLRANTLIVFCSDNGPARLGSAGDFRGGKGSLWEGGHRVCGIFNLPDTIPAGQECSATLMTMDLLPTLVSLAGGELDSDRTLDGINILPALKGEPLVRAPVFWRHGSTTAVRDAEWKLVINKNGNHLFDLGTDPSEQRNLANDQPKRIERMLELVEHWQSELPDEKQSDK